MERVCYCEICLMHEYVNTGSHADPQTLNVDLLREC